MRSWQAHELARPQEFGSGKLSSLMPEQAGRPKALSMWMFLNPTELKIRWSPLMYLVQALLQFYVAVFRARLDFTDFS